MLENSIVFTSCSGWFKLNPNSIQIESKFQNFQICIFSCLQLKANASNIVKEYKENSNDNNRK